MKAIKFKESNYYSVELSRGTYLIDDKVIDIEGYQNQKVQVLDVNNIIPLTKTPIISYYMRNGKEEVNVEDFIEEKQRLLSKRRKYLGYDEDNERDEYEWSSLEDEFEYRKFEQIHQPIRKEIITKGDPLPVEIVESQIETGNEFINSDYINGGKDPLLFTYNRIGATLKIVSDKFKELGMEFKGKLDYSQTKNQKIWGNSSHSHIRYITAFNSYIFNDKWDIKYNPKGNLESLLLQYNSDKKELESIIQQKYNEYFGRFDDKNFQSQECLSKLKLTQTYLNKLDYNKKGYSDYLSIKKFLAESIQIIENSFKSE